MSLDATLRGILEKYIDDIIQGIPQMITLFRQNKVKEMNITTMEDYILGLAQGLIMGSFFTTYRAIYFQDPSLDITLEAGNIVYKRTEI
jgi:hypothetical protein